MFSPRSQALLDAISTRVVVADGAMGTMIQRHKLTEADYRGERFKDWHTDVKGNNDLLCITQPRIIIDIHKQYLHAGADIIETNTFNAQKVSLADYDMQDYADAINRAAVKVARSAVDAYKAAHPNAMILVHPESPQAVVDLADVVGSTSAMIKAVVEGSATEYIVATDKGILHRMQQLAPNKKLIEAPTAGNSATCKSCAHCPWMAMNGLQGILDCLENASGEIFIEEPIQVEALGCIERMLDFTKNHPDLLAKAQHGFVKNIGAA